VRQFDALAAGDRPQGLEDLVDGDEVLLGRHGVSWLAVIEPTIAA
jgi:hypothetical protein